jgi:hypothetical protein
MKLYIEEVHGCFWCPHHVRHGYSSDRKTQGRCKAVIVISYNYKLIQEQDMYDENNGTNPYYKFPEWCPLENK